MADEEHVEIFLQGPKVWNKWREENPEIKPDLSGIDVLDRRCVETLPTHHEENIRNITCCWTDLSTYDLARTNLCNARLSAARFRAGQLEHATLKKAQLEHAYLLGAQLKHANLKETRLEHALLLWAHLEHANLREAHLEHASLEIAHLEQANLEIAHLKHTRLFRAQLEYANFRLAQLESAVLVETQLAGADLRYANLKDANVTNVTFDRWGKYRGIRLDGAYGSPAFIRHAMDQDFIEEFRVEDHLWNTPWKNFLFIPVLCFALGICLLFYLLPYGLLKLTGNRPKFTRQYELDLRYTVYLLWLILADCGRSIILWAAWSVVMALGFAWKYYALGPDAFHLGEKLTWDFHTVVYYSVVTFTTLGFGDVTPVTATAQRWVMAEVILGYVMLGGLISIFANKLARRSG